MRLSTGCVKLTFFFLLALHSERALGQNYTSYANAWYGGTCGLSSYSDAGQFVNDTTAVTARSSEFPWAAAVIQPAYHFFCGASIISDQWILVSAHCLYALGINNTIVSPNDVVVSLYLGSRQQIANFTGPDTFNVSSIIVHQNYTYRAGYIRPYDIALIRIIGSFQFNDSVRPICAPDPNNTYAGQTAVDIKSYSLYTLKSNAAYGRMLYAAANITDEETCYNTIAVKTPIFHDTFICDANVFGRHNGTCFTGALVAKDPVTGLFSQVGLGAGGCITNHITIYTRLSYFINWVSSIINGA